MKKQSLKTILLFCLVAVFLSLFLLPETPTKVSSTEASSTEASSTEASSAKEETNLVEKREALEKELRKLKEEIRQYDQAIEKTEQEKETLQNKIYILRNKIKKLNLQIYQSNIVIEDLGAQVKDTEISIEKTTKKIEKAGYQLAEILRLIYEEDQKNLIEILFSEDSLSDFFSNLVALEALNAKNQEVLEYIKALKTYLQQQKQSLDEEKESLERQVVIQDLQRQHQQQVKQEEERLLKLTEAEYQKYLKEKERVERRAQEIRSRIFELIGVPKAPTFGEAYEIAKFVARQTNVHPAFLLAILTQESDIGKNVGQCYLKNSSNGSGETAGNGKAVVRVMNPKRDVPYFLEVTKGLGRDPYNTLVSCPMSYGWGGAMGPAQFIPSTWNTYQEKIAQLKGSMPDPWNIEDAFLAAAVYLTDLGATKRTYEYEWCAAVSYFSGSCSRRNQIRYEFYGDSVMAITRQYESDIAELEKSS